MIVPDPNSLQSLKLFFAEYRYLSTSELAILANRSMETIREWRKKCGLPTYCGRGKWGTNHTTRPMVGTKPLPKPFERVDKKLLKDPEWVRKAVEKYSLHEIARMTGTRPCQVWDRCHHLGIPTKPHSEVVRSTNPCCTAQWLEEHYEIAGLSLERCAEIANVNPYTIYRWLVKFGKPTRQFGRGGERNSAYGKPNPRARTYMSGLRASANPSQQPAQTVG